MNPYLAGVEDRQSSLVQRMTKQLPDIRLIALALFAASLVVLNLPELSGAAWCLGLLPVVVIAQFIGISFWRPVVIFLLSLAYMLVVADDRLTERLPLERSHQVAEVRGIVTEISRHDQYVQRFELLTDEGKKLRLGWWRSRTSLAVGSCVLTSVKLRSPSGSANPGGFDYEAWLMRRSIAATGSVKQLQEVACKDSMPNLYWNKARAIFRQRLNGWISQRETGDIEEDKNVAGGAMLAALVAGDRSGLLDEHWRALRRSGTAHLVAISGLHVSIVALFGFVLGRFLLVPISLISQRSYAIWGAVLCSMSLATVYALMSGFELPAQRALVMLFAGYLSWLVFGLRDFGRIIAVALVSVLIFDPFAPMSAGFWMSFAAVAAIAFLSAGRVSRQAGWRLLLRIQLGILVLLAPLMAYWFGEVSFAGLAVNIVLVPMMVLVLPVIQIVTAIALLSAENFLANGSLALIVAGLQASFEILELVSNQDLLVWTSGTPHFIGFCALMFGAILLLAPAGLPLRGLGIVMLLSGLFGLPRTPEDGSAKLTVLDVGQGSAAVIQSADKTMLIDAGPAWKSGFDAGQSVVLPWLRSQGIAQLDQIVISHPDLDHRGGVNAVLQEFPEANLMGLGSGTACHMGHQWSWGPADLEVLHPDGVRRSENNASCVIRLTVGDHCAILPGDIERSAERALVKRFAERLRCEVLVVPHHGSASSSTSEFIQAVSPQLAIVSAGWRNRWGFPAHAVVNRYRAMDTKLLRTDQAGAITVEFDQHNILLSSWRDTHRRWWMRAADGESSKAYKR